MGKGLALPELPKIDFSREMIVMLALGTRPSGGYGIIVDKAYLRVGRLEKVVRKESPGRNCSVTMELTKPVDVVRLPKIDREVVFREKEIVHSCK